MLSTNVTRFKIKSQPCSLEVQGSRVGPWKNGGKIGISLGDCPADFLAAIIAGSPSTLASPLLRPPWPPTWCMPVVRVACARSGESIGGPAPMAQSCGRIGGHGNYVEVLDLPRCRQSFCENGTGCPRRVTCSESSSSRDSAKRNAAPASRLATLATVLPSACSFAVPFVPPRALHQCNSPRGGCPAMWYMKEFMWRARHGNDKQRKEGPA